jgi:hypothetical protein
MAKKEKDFKKYGADLEKEYNETKQKLTNLKLKIKKRYFFLKEKTDPEHLEAAKKMTNLPIECYLEWIKNIENEYVAQTRQTELFKKTTMKPEVFNELKDREKWTTFWDENIELNGTWHCKNCGAKDENGPHRASPFRGASVHCGDCDEELTRRTGGGQSDPFNWELKN